jgi:hypothetical protein
LVSLTPSPLQTYLIVTTTTTPHRTPRLGGAGPAEGEYEEPVLRSRRTHHERAPLAAAAAQDNSRPPLSNHTRPPPPPQQLTSVTVRAVDGGLMKKPEAPPKRPDPPRLFGEGGDAAAAAPSTSAAPTPVLAPTGAAAGVTVEYQRQRAKEMRAFLQRSAAFKAQQQESSGFGWTRAAERSNGRWVMFGFAVGLLTEYATGVDFPQQLRLMLSYLGIADIE